MKCLISAKSILYDGKESFDIDKINLIIYKYVAQNIKVHIIH